MKFEEGLKAVLKTVEVNESDHKDFLDDVKVITTEINKAMEANNSIFKDMLKGLKSTAYYNKDSIIDVVDDMQLHLVFKIPFKVKTVLHVDGLKIFTKVKHPIVKDGFVDIDFFKFLMTTNIEIVLSKMKPILCKNDRTFKLSYEFPTIIATEQVEVGTKSTINFSFLPIFQFNLNGAPERGHRFVFPDMKKTYTKGELSILDPNKTPYIKDMFRLVQMSFGKDCFIANDTIVLIDCIVRTMDLNLRNLGSWFAQCSEELTSFRVFVEQIKFFGIVYENPTFLKKLQKLARDIQYYYLMDSVELEDMLALFNLS